MRWFPKVLVRWQEPRWFREKPAWRAKGPTRRERLFVAALFWVPLFAAGLRELWGGPWLPVVLWGLICVLFGLAATRALLWLFGRAPVSVTLWETCIARSQRQIKLSTLAGFSWVNDADGPVLVAFPRAAEALASGVPDAATVARIDSALERLGVPRITWNSGWEEALPQAVPRQQDRALRVWAVAMLATLLLLIAPALWVLRLAGAHSERESALVQELSEVVAASARGSAEGRTAGVAQARELRAELARCKARYEHEARRFRHFLVVLWGTTLLAGLILVWLMLLRPETPEWQQRLARDSESHSPPTA